MDTVDGIPLRGWRKRTLQIISTDKWRKFSDVTPLAQVAGHGSWDKAQAILANDRGCILKPIQEGPRGERELEFYQTLNEPNAGPEAKGFLPFIPKFYGTCKKREGEYMMIENLTEGMKKPCVMDIKIGRKTYGPDASEEKKAKQDASYAGTKKPFGFSVLGMSVYSGTDKADFAVKSKEYGKSLTEENIEMFLKDYFDGRNVSLQKVIVGRLNSLFDMYNAQTSFHIFGSSILFVYDADALLSDNLEDSVVVKMIDFAHVHPAEGQKDDNYLFGLETLIAMMKKY